MQQEFLLAAMALFAGTALVSAFLLWKAGPLHQRAQRINPGIEREFNSVFMTTTKAGKEALIERWMARQKCDRWEAAMRLAVEEWRRENR